VYCYCINQINFTATDLYDAPVKSTNLERNDATSYTTTVKTWIGRAGDRGVR